MCATIFGQLLGNCAGVGGQKGFSVGVGGRKRFSGKGEGSGSEGRGGAIGGVGGKGAESKFQDGGKERIIEEEGNRKGGLGSDSSAERLGTEGVDRSRNGGIKGGIDREEDCRNMSRDCRVGFAVENCVGVGGVKSIDLVRESFMDICLRSVLDKNRI